MHSSLDLDKDVFNINLVSIIQTGWWTGGTARWNGKVQLWPLERKSMLPFRICQKMRRSKNCSPAHVKLNNNYNNTITSCLYDCYLFFIYFWICSYPFIVSFADIHYFHCLQIIEILKGTEASTKNIFGRYSSQRMKVMMPLSAVQFSFNV